MRAKFNRIFAVVTCMFLCVSCSFQNDSFNKTTSVKDISKDTGYERVVTQGFMGGSVIYNPQDQSLGQLSDGVSVAVRFSKAYETDEGDGEVVYGEDPFSARYGLLVVKEISEESITFSIKIYDYEGFSYTEKSYCLAEGQSVDVNGDGVDDIQYKKPAQKRSGFEKAVYLDFLSSQETLTISMFAVLTEQYAGNTYPNGIIGVNPDGRFIVAKYTDTEGSARSVVRGVYKGDYVVDNKDGKYQKVTNNRYSRSARAVSDDDLLDMENPSDNLTFYFIDSDFANYSAEAFLNVLPISIVQKYSDLESAKDILNALLEDPVLMYVIDTTQGSVIPAEMKTDILSQFASFTKEEVVQLNRIFLERNYPYVCPQRITLNEAISEVLPLASVALTESDVNNDIVDELDKIEAAKEAEPEDDVDDSSARAVNFTSVKTKSAYDTKLATLEKRYSDNYLQIWMYDFSKDFQATTKEKKVENGTAKTTIRLKNSRVCIGIKGTYSIAWGSITSSFGAAVFVKASTVLEAKVTKNVATPLRPLKEPKPDDTSFIVTTNLWKKEASKKCNVARFAIGPIVICVNIDLGIGIPVNLSLEADSNVSYSCYVAALAQASITGKMEYGLKLKKILWFKVPAFYTKKSAKASCTATGTYYIDTDANSFDVKLNKLATSLIIAPYARAGIEISAASLVHTGLTVKSGVTGTVKFTFQKPYLIGTYGLKYNNSVMVNAFIGVKGVKVLGINIGDIGAKWFWEMLKEGSKMKSGVLIAEKTFLKVKIK